LVYTEITQMTPAVVQGYGVWSVVGVCHMVDVYCVYYAVLKRAFALLEVETDATQRGGRVRIRS